ncbi:sialate O-acetylesterase [Reichenbachiella agariperforans]|uniref:Sialate O-acetylesterase n=1 Tax=Reichenbachiella agariperforans TaxID=156994 RepID=A0A1M6LY23_REIAG|nr:sialate O-acetylesterase [Reichenbachiella agariperforans]SHJ76089.1 sialate O-acetylesterase [Reichenbachiella agariperforans]
MKKLKIVVLFLLAPVLAQADILLHSLFVDGMVLQRNSEVPIWGWADPGEAVAISASWGANAHAVARADSTWRATLQTPDAGGPFQLTVSGENTLTISDVLSGEVWLCTGQSNMDFAMSQFTKDARESQYQPLVEYMREEIARANDPWIRHIEVPRNTALDGKAKNFEGDWVSVNPEQTGQITATGYFFAKKLREHLNVPIGLVECSWGGTRIQPWIPESAYQANPEMKAYFEESRGHTRRITDSVSVEDFEDVDFEARFAAWKASDRSKSRPWPRVHPAEDKQLPATLYNGMLSAVIPYHIAGAIWYQGESNSHFKEDEHEQYFKTLINSWRSAWGQGDFPFYYMQLANYITKDQRSDVGWAMVNDAIRRALELPNTGMAVLIDIGEGKDVHPHNKMDAGSRLALWALANDHQVKVDAVSGPLFEKAKFKKGKAIVSFDHVGAGLMIANKHLMNPVEEVNEALKHFELAGADGQWHEAIAVIKGKDKVEVSSPQVPKPAYVRYAWASNPIGVNLYNREGLPAAVFLSNGK